MVTPSSEDARRTAVNLWYGSFSPSVSLPSYGLR